MSLRPRNAERTAKILEAATQLFAHQGYHGTTTREIADLADMSENTLFRLFGGKEDVFWAALREGLSGLHLRKDLVDSIADGDLPEVVLPKLFSSLVGTITFKPQVLSLIAVAMIELRWKAESICRVQLGPIFADFHSYLSTNIKNGRIRNLDPVLVTAALGMTALVHPMLSRLLTGEPPPHSDNRDAIRAYTNFWLEILVPLPAHPPHAVIGVSKTEVAEPDRE
jgi:AcrR family transcriptional regulator